MPGVLLVLLLLLLLLLLVLVVQLLLLLLLVRVPVVTGGDVSIGPDRLSIWVLHIPQGVLKQAG
jgi:hypothetical protein